MDPAAAHLWYLRKHQDHSIFGPLTFEQLARWASSAQVAPHDSISPDQEHWMKAPMLPELGMDWIVEITSERLYGPTTLGAIREFMRLGEIDQDTLVINSCNAARQKIGDLAAQLEALPTDGDETVGDEANALAAPGSSGIQVAVPDRIRDLEQALAEERRALAELENRYADLEARHHALLTGPSA